MKPATSQSATPQTYPEEKLSLPWLAGALTFLVLTALASQVAQSSIFSVAALGYYVVLSAYIAKSSPSAFILLLWFIFVRLTTMVSGVAIESGGYMPEMVMSGAPNGAFTRLALFYTFGIVGSVMLINHYLPTIKSKAVPRMPANKWAMLVFGLTALLCLWAFFIGLKNGFPLLTNTDRVVYWKQVSSRFLFFFLGNRTILAALLGVVYATTVGFYRRSSLGLMVIILGLSFLFAEKFTSICQILIFFITPIFLLNEEALRKTPRRMITFGLLISALTMPVVLVVYGIFDDPAAAVERLQARATSQAEVWYVADLDNGTVLGLDTNLARYNIKSLLSLDADEMSRDAPYLGARDFMSQYLENARYNSYVERGVTLTMASEGYLVKVFGWLLAVPAYLLIMVVYSLQLLYFAYAIFTHNPVRIILASKLLVWSNYGLNQGYFWNIIGAPILLLMAIIFVVELKIYKKPTPLKANLGK